ncbi:uroporphyrinogen-III synthase [Haliea salexigens]|uniref:uroporphyrinogen-III synthase n=1 Tax=Haliea salexigens TaxID=287487 RepID=UPI0006857538|nr:uroporphyrinogen-III synthase [Haliea salexigens]
MVARSVLVTRPAGQGEQLCSALAARGFTAHHLPFLQLQPLTPLPVAERLRVQALDRVQHVIFVSANAVGFGMPIIEGYWPQLPQGLQWYAVGDGTARALGGFDIVAETPGENMTSEGLLNLPGLRDCAGERVLIVKGQGGRDTLRQELSRRGAHVETLACYRRVRPAMAPGALATALADWQIEVICISSGDGLNTMLALLSPEETTKLRGVTLLLPSRRVADAAMAAGFQHCLVADNASDGAMLRALEHWSPAKGEKK